MNDVELRRAGDDRRAYELPGVGRMALQGWAYERARVAAGERTWRVARGGALGQHVDAVDEDGALVARFKPGMTRGGGIELGDGTRLRLRSRSRWRHRFALVAEGGRDLAVFDARGWDLGPLRASVEPDVDPLLLLFCAFVVQALAGDEAASASSLA